MRTLPLGLQLCLIALAVPPTGCSDSSGRIGVSGNVTLKGQPLDDGIVEFVPIDGQGTQASTMCSGGKYKIAADKGLKPGKYRIRITAGDGKTPYRTEPSGPDSPSGPPGPGGKANIISKELVPRDWNIDSKQERTITKEGPNVFDFEIP
jgi:hypothetical protein